MKRLFIILLALLAAPAFAQQSVPELPFESVPNFFKYPTDQIVPGEMTSVAVNSKGHIFMLSHSGISGHAFAPVAAQVLEFDARGNYLRQIGKGAWGLAYPHSIRFDRDDNLWVVDRATSIIMRFNPAGYVTMVLGRRPFEVRPNAERDYELTSEAVNAGKVPPPVGNENSFNWPTDIAWDAAGNMYISDGYVNSRVAKMDKNGDWVKAWGTRGKDPGQFNTPHNIAVDSQGNVYVADRGNARIQVFDGDGKLLRVMKIDVPVPPGIKNPVGNTPSPLPTGTTFSPGAPWAICITPGPTQYIYSVDAYPGRLYKLPLDGKVVGVFGKSGKQLNQFSWPHGVSCPSENEVYVADMNNWRVQKLVPRSTR